MKDIPIIFSGAMVRALLREAERPGTGKTQTRRIAWGEGKLGTAPADGEFCIVRNATIWQKVKPGDRLWVRERTLCQSLSMHGPHYSPWEEQFLKYEADGAEAWVRRPDRVKPTQIGDRLSMGCYREASRLTLIVTATKVEPVQSISEEDAIAEGWKRRPDISDDPEVHRNAARDWYSDLWSDLHGIESWKSNPEVVAITFRVINQNIDAIAREA